MSAAAHAIALRGVEGVPVRVEAQLGPGLVSTTIVGLADTAVKESRERLRAALTSCRIPAPRRRLTINLSPASLPKVGTGFDLPIAVAVLCARGFLDPQMLPDTVFTGELGLDGSVRSSEGAAAQTWASSRNGFDRIVVPTADAPAASDLGIIDVFACSHLQQLLDAFPGPEWQRVRRTRRGPQTGSGWQGLVFTPEEREEQPVGPAETDLADVRGQADARKALLVAAAGGHHLLLYGDAGSGKTMLAERLAGVLPPLGRDEARILAAMRSSFQGHTKTPKWEVPQEILYPTTTLSALVGGGQKQVRPGLISLAHGGVLVLNEAPDFSPRVLDALRGPLDTGEVTLNRSGGAVTFPAEFQLVLTANHCPCGRGSPGTTCQCTVQQKRRYQARLSGPLLDRVDIYRHLARPHPSEIAADEPLTSAAARELVTEARRRSRHRWARDGWTKNSQVPGKVLRAHGGLPPAYAELLERQIAFGRLSLRGADRILRLAWSIADLEGHPGPTAADLSFALDLRTKNSWEAE